MFAGDRTGETVTQNMREERCWDTNSDKDHVTEITANNQDINLTGISQNLRGGESWETFLPIVVRCFELKWILDNKE